MLRPSPSICRLWFGVARLFLCRLFVPVSFLLCPHFFAVLSCPFSFIGPARFHRFLCHVYTFLSALFAPVICLCDFLRILYHKTKKKTMEEDRLTRINKGFSPVFGCQNAASRPFLLPRRKGCCFRGFPCPLLLPGVALDRPGLQGLKIILPARLIYLYSRTIWRRFRAVLRVHAVDIGRGSRVRPGVLRLCSNRSIKALLAPL